MTLRTIQDMNNDGHEDVFIVSTTASNGSLFLIDGKTGNIFKTSGTLGFEPLEALFIEEPSTRIVVAYSGGIKVYDLDFNKIHEFSTPYTPSSLQTFDGNEVVFFHYAGGTWGDFKIVSYSLVTGSLQWSKSYLGALGITRTITELLVLNSTRMVVFWQEDYPLEEYWNADIRNNNGDLLSRVYRFGGASYWDTLSLNSYNSTHFLYSRETSTSRFVKLSTIVGNSEIVVWNTQVWNKDGNDGFVTVDANHDGTNDVAAVLGGNVVLLNGTDGKPIYTISEIFASNITDVAILSDVNNDGTNEVAIHADHSYLISFGQSNYMILWEEEFGSEGIDAIEDVDGDGNKEVIAATNNEITCHVGSELDTISPT
ncbi:MAG: hypothetical protein ACE5KD_04040, partial [Candidatus Bathyarchaeia archaeon]